MVALDVFSHLNISMGCASKPSMPWDWNAGDPILRLWRQTRDSITCGPVSLISRGCWPNVQTFCSNGFSLCGDLLARPLLAPSSGSWTCLDKLAGLFTRFHFFGTMMGVCATLWLCPMPLWTFCWQMLGFNALRIRSGVGPPWMICKALTLSWLCLTRIDSLQLIWAESWHCSRGPSSLVGSTPNMIPPRMPFVLLVWLRLHRDVGLFVQTLHPFEKDAGL